jgi:hypothetical protein
MAWRFRKSKNIDPFRATVSKKGIGTSFGLLGFRFGVSPDLQVTATIRNWRFSG